MTAILGSVNRSDGSEFSPTSELKAEELKRLVNDMFGRNKAAKLILDPSSGQIVDANPAAAAFYGWSIDELRAMNISQINQSTEHQIHIDMARAATEDRTYFEFQHRLRSGDIRDVQVYTGPCQLGSRKLLFSIICDITERKRLAERVAQTQRMESLGRMAGGIAHDVNNLLTSIEMLTNVIQRKHSRGEFLTAELEDVHDIVKRGANMTSQLLAFCRQQIAIPTVVNFADSLRSMERVLTRLISEKNITIDLKTPSSALIYCAPSQAEQILLNLAVNAADAMPEGGTLTMKMSNEQVTEGSPLALAAGNYVLLQVSDTGTGIAPESLQKIFEPFFTTKTHGKGTGLGLATVYGIVTQHDGSIKVHSVLGQGTTFAVYLPSAESKVQNTNCL